MAAYEQIIKQISADADVERVLDIADANFRFFAEMTSQDWAACVAAAL